MSEVEIANIIFNESRSLSGPNIDDARYNMAQAINNGDEKLGSKRPITAPTTLPKKGIPKAETHVYQQCLNASMKATNDRIKGIDPTNGAIYFNFRGSASKAKRYNLPVQTHVGPLKDSFPKSPLKPTGNYANTYGN